MCKPAGSTYWWHAQNNHERCDITNIPESANAGSAAVPTSQGNSAQSGTQAQSGKASV
jgi:hypothetical protein